MREDLVLVNHYDCARELFYQLALTQFGGGSALAKLGEGGVGGVDIRAVAQAVQLEDAIQQSASEGRSESSCRDFFTPISETNTMLAEQASACLVDNAEMLEEYFSVVIEIDDEDKIMLTGLPVLLEGYTPQTHALPMFLLRLATEVDWSEEMHAFSLSGACCVLRRAPVGCRPWSTYPAPAISSDYYVPHERLKEDGAFHVDETVQMCLNDASLVKERCL
jgi:DNA mismatch repair protein MLH1